MAITWGGLAGHFQLGLDIIVSGQTATIIAYGRNENGYSHNWNSTLSFGSSWGGSKAVSFSSGLSVTTKELHRSSATFTGTRTYSVAMPIPYWGGTASWARSVTIANPKPNAPNIDRVVRVSDTSHRPEWTRTSTYTSVIVQRGPGDGTMAQVGRPTGNAANFTDTTTKPNSRYYYRAAGVNAGGQSGWSNTFGPIYTTPNAPTSVTAARSGNNIVVTATAPSSFSLLYDVMDGATQIATGVPLPYTHQSPSNTVTHQYKVRAKITSQASGVVVTGAWSTASNVVQLPAAPAAPTGLDPNGALTVDDLRPTLRWKHNPIDSSAQTAANVQYRLVGASTWTTVTATTAEQVTLAAPLPVGAYEWQVQTKGNFATYSPYSATARFTVISRPGVGIDVPGASWDAPTLPAVWTWFHAEGRPQSSWELQLIDETGQNIESRNGQGDTHTFTLTSRLADGSSYLLRVRAATGEVWSEWAEASFDVVFVPPAPPQLIVGWDETTGAAILEITEGTVPAGAPQTATITIDRSVDSGETWEPYRDGDHLQLAVVDPGDPRQLTVSDYECLSSGHTLYRVTAYTAIGALASSEGDLLADSDAIWVSGGGQFTNAARLPYDPEVDLDVGRQRTMHRFSGRELGVVVSTEQLERKVQASGTLYDDDEQVASREQLRLVAIDSYPVHMYRDPDGNRIFGLLGNVPMKREADGVWSYSISLDESER